LLDSGTTMANVSALTINESKIELLNGSQYVLHMLYNEIDLA